MTTDQQFIFNRALSNVRGSILRPRTIDAALISMGMNITGPIVEFSEKNPDTPESIKWKNDIYPRLMDEAKNIMKIKNKISDNESEWKAELEKFIIPLEEYSNWYFKNDV